MNKPDTIFCPELYQEDTSDRGWIEYSEEKSGQPGVAACTRSGDMMTTAVLTDDISSTLHLSLNVMAERYHVDNHGNSRACCDACEDIDIPVMILTTSPV